MEITRSPNNRYHILVDKNFSFPDCYTNHKEIKALLEEGYKVVLDFTECTYIDSSALGSLFSLRKYFSEGAELKLINANSHIMSIFKIYKLGQSLNIDKHDSHS